MIYHHNKGICGLEVLRPVNTYFGTPVNLETYRLPLHSQKYNGHISRKIAKLAKIMKVQMMSFIFKPFNHTSIFSFLHNFKTARDSKELIEEATMWLFPHFMRELSKAALSYWMSATEKTFTYKEVGIEVLQSNCQIFTGNLSNWWCHCRIRSWHQGLQAAWKLLRRSLFGDTLGKALTYE